MPDSKLDAKKYSSAPNEKHLLETQIQEKIDADTRTRQADVLERMCLLARKDHLGLGDWVEIVGIGIRGESNYTISNNGIFFNGWDQEFIDSHPLPHEQARLTRQNEEPGLVFPCTPTELLDFVDTGVGRLFGSFIVDDEFRRVVVEIERSLARAARLGRASSPHTAEKDEEQNPWLIANPTDPAPEQPWYTPARYFARQLVKSDPTLLLKRQVLAQQVRDMLTAAGIKKRGGRNPLDANTVLKAFVNVSLG